MAQARGSSGGLDPEDIRIWLLGGSGVLVGSRITGDSDWRLKKARSLIKLLALMPGYRFHREQAMEWL